VSVPAACLLRAGIVFVIAAYSTFSHAAQRTFVASTGSDAAACSIGQPCRSFAAAIAQTDPQGEVIVLDSAGYGAVTINQDVSIIAPTGIYAGISVFSGDGIAINNTSPTGRVVLRGLTINGQGGDYGIYMFSGNEVHIESCTISGLKTAGISAAAANSHVRVADSTLRSNLYGIVAGGGSLVVDNSSFSRNKSGVQIVSSENATIRGSRFEDNVLAGLEVLASGTSSMTVAASQSDFSGNGSYGINIDMAASTAFASVTLDRVSVHNSDVGVGTAGFPGSLINLSVGESQFTFNAAYGIRSGSLGVVLTTVSDSTVNDNDVGVYASGSSVFVGLNHDTIARNGTNDIQQMSSAVVRTFGNNALTGNASGDVSGSLTSVSPR
jgi:hypothetical protein